MVESHKNLAAALLAFQAEAPKLHKDTPAGQGKFSYKYVDLADLREAIRPFLTKHGLVWQTFPCLTPQGEPGLRYKLTHAPSGDCESDVMPLVMSKQDSQAFGSAVTYGRRYAVTAVLDLVADADDDGERASKRPADNGARKFATASDIEELRAASAGLTPEQIRLAIGSRGIVANGWAQIPQDKVVELARVLVDVERSS